MMNKSVVDRIEMDGIGGDVSGSGGDGSGDQQKGDSDFELDRELLTEDDLPIDNDETSESDPDKPSMNATLYHLISNYGAEVSNLLVKEFGKSQVHLQHLASLSDEDLKLVGVTNAEVRQAMLAEFAQLPNQVDHYDQIITTSNPNKYNNETLNNISNHLSNLKASLSIALLELRLKPTENSLVNQRTYASNLVLKMLEEIEKYSRNIELQLEKLEEPKFEGRRKRSRMVFNCVMAVGTVAIGSVLLYRYGAPNLPLRGYFR